MRTEADHYATLGVLPTAEDAVIRAAYRVLAQKYHPDKFTGSADVAHERMKYLNLAYSILKDPVKRADYDMERADRPMPNQDKPAHHKQPSPQESTRAQPNEAQIDERRWEARLQTYPDLAAIEDRLNITSKLLGEVFRRTLLKTNDFRQRSKITEGLENDFLERYFGKNEDALLLAREFIRRRKKKAARELNSALTEQSRSMTTNAIIQKLKRRHIPYSEERETELMHEFSIDFDGFVYTYRGFEFDTLPDALASARSSH